MARRSSERVYGPFKHRNRWRLVFVTGDGRRTPESFASESECTAAIADYRAEIEGKQVSEAIAEYLDACRGRELRETSIATTGHRLRALMQVDEEAGRTGGPIDQLTPARGRQLVAAMNATMRRGRPLSLAHRRGALAEAGTFARWCVERGYLLRDAFAGLKLKGRVKRGKAQLTIEQARSFGGYCLEAAAAGDRGALAALLCLLLGCRASEVTDRLVRDVDDGASILWIPEAKTEAGRRRLEVPDLVRALLTDACHDKLGRRRPATARLFEDGDRDVDRHWLRYQVDRLCTAAKVPPVCTQSLRGLHATLATAAGTTAHAVAMALGHTSPTITERHYTKSDATAGARQARAFQVLAGGKTS